jgi:hypothetical protein
MRNIAVILVRSRFQRLAKFYFHERFLYNLGWSRALFLFFSFSKGRRERKGRLPVRIRDLLFLFKRPKEGILHSSVRSLSWFHLFISIFQKRK